MRVTLLSLTTVSALICCGVESAPAQTSMDRYGIPQIGTDGGANQGRPDKEKYPVDDPMVNSATPPPTGTKLITKVGWCEVQVFGHTFTDAGLTAASLPATHMHLSDRLQQLNQKLKFSPTKKGLGLMDNIDELVTFISKRPPSEAAASKKPAE
ncbi:MAG: hypothetical protein P4L53_20795 [Candidatus Obscuribacterales bacterium]|nr:hypothetical protein [Candidatus Obscuribacterales bacterium]